MASDAYRVDRSSSNRGSSWGWWTLIALHLLVIVVGFTADDLIAAIGCSSLVLLVSLWAVLAHGALYSFALVLIFIFGNAFLFGYMNYAYLNFTTLPTGSYHDVSAWLSALSGVSTLIGAGLMHVLLGRDSVPSKAPPIMLRRETLLVWSCVFAALVAGQLATGFLTARFETSADTNSFGPRYLVNGIGWIWLVFFLVLGTRLQRQLLAAKNVLIIALVTIIALLQGLSGGRGLSLFIVAMLLVGAAWSQVERHNVVLLATAFGLVGIVFSLSVQEARGQRSFAHGSAYDRATLLQHTAADITQDLLESERSSGNVLEPLIARMFEFTGQDIIDHTIRTQHHAGFENFDRLAYLFVPKYLAPEKLPISDGVEILTRELGYDLGNTGVPVTLIGDSFRRGGEVWVAVVAFAAGMILRLLPRITLRLLGPDFAVPFIAVYGIHLIALHGESVLGAISATTYHFLKHVLIFGAIAAAIRLTIKLFEPRVQRAADLRIRTGRGRA